MSPRRIDPRQRANEIAAGINLIGLRYSCPTFYAQIRASIGMATTERYIAAARASLKRIKLNPTHNTKDTDK